MTHTARLRHGRVLGHTTTFQAKTVSWDTSPRRKPRQCPSHAATSQAKIVSWDTAYRPNTLPFRDTISRLGIGCLEDSQICLGTSPQLSRRSRLMLSGLRAAREVLYLSRSATITKASLDQSSIVAHARVMIVQLLRSPEQRMAYVSSAGTKPRVGAKKAFCNAFERAARALSQGCPR